MVGKKKPGSRAGLDLKDLAATYSRGVYKTTTIGKAAFDGRVRNGNGSDHSFMATKNPGGRPLLLRSGVAILRSPSSDFLNELAFSENYTQVFPGLATAPEYFQSQFPLEEKRSSLTTD